MTVTLHSPVITGGNADMLYAIRDEETSLANWEREPPFAVASGMLPGFRNIRFQSRLHDLPCELEQALADARCVDEAACANLHADMVMLANHFAAIMNLAEVEIRLEHITTNACKKFHADHVTARLICTYSGQGTQWLDGAESDDCDDETPHNIQQMQAGYVGLFKGRIWALDAPAIHRSPPIEGTGEERLLLVINPATALED
jgi:Protein of unknown function (DUF1826)